MKSKLLISFCIMLQLNASGFNNSDGAPIRQGVHIEWYRTIAPGADRRRNLRLVRYALRNEEYIRTQD